MITAVGCTSLSSAILLFASTFSFGFMGDRSGAEQILEVYPVAKGRSVMKVSGALKLNY